MGAPCLEDGELVNYWTFPNNPIPRKREQQGGISIPRMAHGSRRKTDPGTKVHAGSSALLIPEPGPNLLCQFRVLL